MGLARVHARESEALEAVLAGFQSFAGAQQGASASEEQDENRREDWRLRRRNQRLGGVNVRE